MDITKHHPVRFTLLSFHFNSLIDQGEFLDIKETYQKIDSGELFNWLKEKFSNRLDLSLYDEDDRKYFTNFFGSLYNAVDAERQFGVIKNGLCLLLAYCIEGIQQNPSLEEYSD